MKIKLGIAFKGEVRKVSIEMLTQGAPMVVLLRAKLQL